MRDNKPFGILSKVPLIFGRRDKEWYKPVPRDQLTPDGKYHLQPSDSYLIIDAKAQLIGDGDRVLEEIPFTYDEKAFVFIPLSRNVRWDVVRELMILIDLKYKIFAQGVAEGSGTLKMSQTWRVNYGDKGIILEAGLLDDLGSSGEGRFVVNADVKTDQPSREAMLTSTTLLLKLTGGSSEDGIALGVGPIEIPVGSRSSVYSKSYRLKVGLLAYDAPKARIQLPEDLLEHMVFFDKEDGSKLSSPELRRLEDTWLDPLKSRVPDLVSAIRDGSCPIYLSGYASVTGKSHEHNMGLSTDRVWSVKNAIAMMLRSDKIDFVPSAHGRSKAKQGGAATQERRVEIMIARHYAEQALKAKSASA